MSAQHDYFGKISRSKIEVGSHSVQQALGTVEIHIWNITGVVII
ncbi:hypothetical protein BLGI_2794 [Brevibacillus laterosporus GI-9]|nr:hypothetical protein BLGI_2794 [Brevibacillus laterosporus GI-9]